MQLRNRLDIQLRNVCLIFRVKAPWNLQPSQGTGQGVSMTLNAASRLRSLEDRSAALGSSRCELPGMHSVPKSAVLPYASGVGGLSRRLLNMEFWSRRSIYKSRVLEVKSSGVLEIWSSGNLEFWTSRELTEVSFRGKPGGVSIYIYIDAYTYGIPCPRPTSMHLMRK